MSAFENPGRATPMIRVEFLGGDDIVAACYEAVRIARTIGCLVVFDFNGVRCMARPHTDPLALADCWLSELQKPPAAYKVAS